MTKLYSSVIADIVAIRKTFKVKIDVYTDWTCLHIYHTDLAVKHLQCIIDDIFFYSSVYYNVRFTDLCTVVYVNSSSVCDKYIAN